MSLPYFQTGMFGLTNFIPGILKISRIFMGSITFLHGNHLFAELGHGGFVKPVRTVAFTQNSAAAT